MATSETVGIRKLKAHLSAYVGRARDGETVLVTDRGTVVARLVPPSEADAATRALRDRLAAVGVAWSGLKPLGVPMDRAARFDEPASLARAVLENRD